MLVLVLKDSLRTKMQSLSWSLNKSPWSCPCVQFYLEVNLLKRHVQVQVSLLLIYLLSYTLNPLLALFFNIFSNLTVY